MYGQETNNLEDYSKLFNTTKIIDKDEHTNWEETSDKFQQKYNYYVNAVLGKGPNEKNSFESAWNTDHAISLIKNKKN